MEFFKTMKNHEAFLEAKFLQVAKLIPENSKILDIGCNDGKIRLFLKNPAYFGVDIDKDLVKKLKEEGVSVKQVDLNKNELPFKEEKFDFILLLDILEHVANPQKLLLDAKERLAENGKLIISLPNDYHILNKARFIFNKHLTENPFAPYGHLHYFPIKSGKRFLEDNGFGILETFFLTPIQIKFLTSLFPQAFVRDVLYLLTPRN
jgi:methionine biosynthesis protein MetW